MKKVMKMFVVIAIITTMLSVHIPTFVLAKNMIKENKNISSSVNKKSNDKKIKKEDLYKAGQAIVMYKNNYNLGSSNKSDENDIKILDTVEFKDKNSEQIKTKSVNGLFSKKDEKIRVSLVSSDKYSTEELVKKLKEQGNILYAEPNYIMKASSVTNDSYEKYQWAIENNGQNAGISDNDINPVFPTDEDSTDEKVIAIIDSGVDYTNPELKDIMWNNPYDEKDLPGQYGYDFVNEDDDPLDDNSHGTHCAGIIGAQSNNKQGITGELLGANNVKIMALKFLDNEGSGSTYDAIRAYNYIYLAQLYGTDVVAINNSWGGAAEVTDDELDEGIIIKRIIDLVGENGAISVCAAGNEGIEFNEDGTFYLEGFFEDYHLRNIPGGIKSNYIITVAASNESDELAAFSNYGGNVDIAAPGTNILSTVTNYTLNPTIYTQKEKDELCAQYEDFNNKENVEYCNTDGEVEIDSKEFFGTDGSSLCWRVPEDGETHYLAIPINSNLLNEEDYYGLLSAKIKIYKVDDDGNKIQGNSLYSLGVSKLDYMDIEDNFGYESYNIVYDNEALGKGNYWTSINKITYLTGMKSVIIALDTANYYFGDDEEEYDDRKEFVVCLDDLAISRNAYKCTETYDEFWDEYSNDYEGNTEYLDKVGKYDFYNGTSMATPFVTAAVAVAANKYKEDDVIERKTRILSSVRESDDLTDKVRTNGTLDLSRLEDKPDDNMVEPEIKNIECDTDGNITITGKNFGNNPNLYINNKLVRTSYDKENGVLKYKKSIYANRTVEIRVENLFYSETKTVFLVTGKDFNKGNFDINGNIKSITTDGNKSIVYTENGDLAELKCDNNGILYKKINNIYDSATNVFSEYNNAFQNNYLDIDSDIVYANGYIYAIFYYSNDISEYKTVLAYCNINEKNPEWKKATDLKEFLSNNDVIRNSSIAAYNGEIYLIGGSSENDDIISKKVFKYNQLEDNLEEIVSLPEGRINAKAIQYKDKLLVMFGYDGTLFVPTTLIYDGKEWKESNATIDIDNDYGWYEPNVSLAKEGIIVTGLDAEGIGNTFLYDVEKDTYKNIGYKINHKIDEYGIFSTAVNDKLYTFKDSKLYTMPINSGLLSIKLNDKNNSVKLVDANNKEIDFNKKYLPGTKVTITALPKEGYKLKTVKVNGQIAKNNKYSGLINNDINVNVESEKIVKETDKSNNNIITITDIGKISIFGIKDKTYSGQPLIQQITIKNGKIKLRDGIDYYIEYSNNINPGKATIKIFGIGNYKGKVEKTFKINPKGVSLKKVKAGKKQIKITWNKNTKQTSGYQIQYSTNKSFKNGNKSVNIKKNKTTSNTVKKLKTKKKYYVRIRTYKTVKGVKYYSGWSKAKNVTVL